MKVVVWVVSAVLALAFLFVGGFKVFSTAAELATGSNGIPVAVLRIAGATELLGALGLILPAVTRIAPVLTPIAAAGLAVQMLVASIVNTAIGAYPAIAETATLMVVAAFVAWMRFGRYAVEPRSSGSRTRPATAG